MFNLKKFFQFNEARPGPLHPRRLTPNRFNLRALGFIILIIIFLGMMIYAAATGPAPYYEIMG